jgi:hypothetical protein
MSQVAALTLCSVRCTRRSDARPHFRAVSGAPAASLPYCSPRMRSAFLTPTSPHSSYAHPHSGGTSLPHTPVDVEATAAALGANIKTLVATRMS